MCCVPPNVRMYPVNKPDNGASHKPSAAMYQMYATEPSPVFQLSQNSRRGASCNITTGKSFHGADPFARRNAHVIVLGNTTKENIIMA